MNKFIVSSSALLKALAPLSGIIGNNPVVPILDNFLFEVSAGQLVATASDLEVTISTTLAIEAKDAFAVTVQARKLLDTLKNLPDQPLTFTYDEEKNSITLASVNGKYKLATESAADYPKPRDTTSKADPLELPTAVLQSAIARTNFGISTDELRPAMCGVLIQLTNTQLTFVATDGHRLLRYRRTDLGAGNPPRNLIIPRKAWALLKSTLGTDGVVACRFTENFGVFDYGSLTLHTRLIDERYPDYNNVIPVSNPNVLLIDRLELLGSVRRMALYANRTTHQVKLRLSGSELVVSAQDLDFENEAREALACQYDGEDFEIGFNARFLIEMLGNLASEQVSLALSTPNRAGLLSPLEQSEGEDILMLVMPVMLNNYV